MTNSLLWVSRQKKQYKVGVNIKKIKDHIEKNNEQILLETKSTINQKLQNKSPTNQKLKELPNNYVLARVNFLLEEGGFISGDCIDFFQSLDKKSINSKIKYINSYRGFLSTINREAAK